MGVSMKRLHVRERLNVLVKWLQMGSCLNVNGYMGGYYPPELMDVFYRSMDEYEEALEKLREKTGKSR